MNKCAWVGQKGGQVIGLLKVAMVETSSLIGFQCLARDDMEFVRAIFSLEKVLPDVKPNESRSACYENIVIQSESLVDEVTQHKISEFAMVVPMTQELCGAVAHGTP